MRRGALLLLAVIAFGFVGADGAAAQVRNLFEVLNIPVDETAENAEAARQQALAAGERKAFEVLVERITRADDRARLEGLAQAERSPLIKDFWISQEKASHVRYIATLNYNFRRDRVRSLLGRRGVAFSTQPSKPAVIVPVLQHETGPLLWEEANVWRSAFAKQGGTDLVPLQLADAGRDGPWLTTDQALTHDAAALTALVQRHDAGMAVVAVAALSPTGGAEQYDLQLALHRRVPAAEPVSTSHTLHGKPGESPEALLLRGARETALILDAEWKGQTRVLPRPVAVTAVTIPLADLRTWLTVRRRIGSIDAVQGIELIMMSKDRALANLVFAGSEEELASALQLAGLELKREADGWVLRVGGAQRTAQGT